jgi:DNA (cytosine-5)-methyltransferase 3A
MKPISNPNGLTVLSLFDGLSCAKLAFDKTGIKINKYYSSEIDKSAIEIQNYHYSADTNFIQLGDVCKIDTTGHLSDEVDCVVFGSPCTNLSSINPVDRRGLEGTESKLFYEALRILKEIYVLQPPLKKLYFIMENVASMKNIDRDIITKELSVIDENVQLLKINSSSLSGAKRARYYWTNIPNIEMPMPIETKYSDVLVNGYVDRDKANVLLSGNVTLTNGISRYYKMNIGNIIFKDEVFAKLPTDEKLKQYPAILKASGYESKTRSVQDEYGFSNGCYRLPSILESERLMTIPDGYVLNVPNVSRTNKIKAIGLAMTVDVIAHLLTPLKNIYPNE